MKKTDGPIGSLENGASHLQALSTPSDKPAATADAWWLKAPLNVRPAAARRKKTRPMWCPTPQEIEAACADIRASWPAAEERRRRVGNGRRVRVQLVPLNTVLAQIDERLHEAAFDSAG